MKPHSVYITIILAILIIFIIAVRERNRLYEETKGVEVLRQTVDRLNLTVKAQSLKWKSIELLLEMSWLCTVMETKNKEEIKKIRSQKCIK